MTNKTKLEDAQVAQRLIESWDLQHGYDDIDWKDKLAEIIPELAAAISTAHANGVRQGAEAERDFCYAEGDEGSKYCGDPKSKHCPVLGDAEFWRTPEAQEHLVKCMRDDHLIHHAFLSVRADVADQPEASEARLRNQADNLVRHNLPLRDSQSPHYDVLVEAVTAALLVAYRSGGDNAGYVAGLEAGATKCDERGQVFGPKSLVADSYTRGLIDGSQGCAIAIRALVTPQPVEEQDSTKEVL